jgi:glycosyltransferase involved in cell wall biosynthesis
MALTTRSSTRQISDFGRPSVAGKSFHHNGDKLLVRGVTYGTFRNDYPAPDIVARDLEEMIARGINAVRTYTVPPGWLLDLAHDHGLLVMVGVPWEQHVAFLDSRARCRSIRDRVAAGVNACAGHPAVLSYAIGNEIPASIVRWHGHRRVERHLERLYEAAKLEDPGAPATYVNYPMTEYLCLPFLDFVCFNVFLESPSTYDAYLARLQNIAGDRPLVVGETGLDSRRNGVDAQAAAVGWQVRRSFDAGAAGVFVFSWSDDWHRGGAPVDDWDFGLVDRAGLPKPALAAAAETFREVPFSRERIWPRISVVVCVYNGADTLPACLEALRHVDYPDFEVIVVDDGSTDDTPAIAAALGFQLIRQRSNGGLAAARNAGLAQATGEIVAYLDADASPDSHWLQYLAADFSDSAHAGIGGPNIAPSGDGFAARAVANAPGGPIHVLLSDREAEHIPGCNMAFRKASLEAIGGFDPRFRVAGDDVDVCWSIQERGWTLGFSPGAVVWHHARGSVRAYLRQQYEYGKAEALLERKWPEKYNASGHVSWSGHVYANGQARKWWPRPWRVYYGMWGSSLFQRAVSDPLSLGESLPLMTESYLLIAALAALSALGLLWSPLLLSLPLLVLAAAGVVAGCALAGRRAVAGVTEGRVRRVGLAALTSLLFGLQPLARLAGRVRHGLSPWRRSSTRSPALPRRRTTAIWSEGWQSVEDWLRALERRLRADGAVVVRGGPYDRWDLEVTGGMLGGVRLRVAVEEHGQGRQMLLVRSWPGFSRTGTALAAVLTVLAATAAAEGAEIVSAVLVATAVAASAAGLYECALSVGSLRLVLDKLGREEAAAAEAGDLVADLTQLVPVAVNGNGGLPRPNGNEALEDEVQYLLKRRR